jgi:hypothetical protein
MRQNAKRGAAALLVLAVAAGLVLFVQVYNDGSKLPAVEGMGAQPGGSAAPLGPSPATSKPAKGVAADAGISSFPASLTSKIGRRTLPGMPTHTVRMEVTAKGSVASLGYLVPTSDVTPYGVLHNVTQPWSKTLTAVGTIYLAGIFIQNGRDATSATCTIYIDGQVADQQTFLGPYKRGICIA